MFSKKKKGAFLTSEAALWVPCGGNIGQERRSPMCFYQNVFQPQVGWKNNSSRSVYTNLLHCRLLFFNTSPGNIINSIVLHPSIFTRKEEEDNVIEVYYYLHATVNLRSEQQEELLLFLSLRCEWNSTIRLVFEPQNKRKDVLILLKMSDPAMREECKLAITDRKLADNDFEKHVLEGFAFR